MVVATKRLKSKRKIKEIMKDEKNFIKWGGYIRRTKIKDFGFVMVAFREDPEKDIAQ